MKRVQFIQFAGLFAVSIFLSAPGAAFAQNASSPSSMKTIGTPSAAAKPEIVPSLFVLNSRGATLQGDTLDAHRRDTRAPSSSQIARCEPPVIRLRQM